MCAEGKCRICAKPAVTKHHCAYHADKQREYSRNKYRAAHGIPLDAPKHSTYGGKKRAAKAEPQYRDLIAGEILKKGDQFLMSNGEWVTMSHDGRHRVSAARGVRYRRPVKDSIISEPAPAEYRTLNPGELIQSGDEICLKSKWETVHDCLVGWRIGVDAAPIRRRRKPLVLSCDSRLPVINLQPMKPQ